MTANVIVTVDPSDKDFWPMMSRSLRSYVTSGHTNHLIHVVPKTSPIGQFSKFVPKDVTQCHREEARKLLSKMAQQIVSNISAKMHQIGGHVQVNILDLTNEIGVNKIVVRKFIETLKDYLLGPKVAHIVRHAECYFLIACP